MAYMRLGDLLLSSGVISHEQLERALELQKESKERLGDVLVQSGIITEQQLIEALKIQLGVEFVDLTAVSIPVELAKYVPRTLAKKYCVVPVKLVRDTLYLAMSDPLDFIAQEEVKAASRKRVIPMIATHRATEQAISRLYGSEGTARVIEEMKREAGSAGPDIVPAQLAKDSDSSEGAPTIRFVNSLIERAFAERASDIHLEPQKGEMVVRMRIDGLLRRVLTVPAELQSTVISRLKIMGGMDIAERKVPQDGHAMLRVKGSEIDLRISSMPTVYGEKIVLRLLNKTSQLLSRDAIGLVAHGEVHQHQQEAQRGDEAALELRCLVVSQCVEVGAGARSLTGRDILRACAVACLLHRREDGGRGGCAFHAHGVCQKAHRAARDARHLLHGLFYPGRAGRAAHARDIVLFHCGFLSL